MFAYQWEAKNISVEVLQDNQTHLCIYTLFKKKNELCTGLALIMFMFVFPWEAKFISGKLMQGNKTHLCIYILVERELNHICCVPIKLYNGSFCCFI